MTRIKPKQLSLLLVVWALIVLAAWSVAPSVACAEESKSPAVEKPAAVDTAEVLEFKQSKVTAETSELEERIFRLSEAMKQLEPENSSRLLLALKFAREELIRHQMAGTERLLKGRKLSEAAAEEKQILAKLQRLQDLLLSADLDFQMRLERLRQLRDVLRRLDRAIQEESRELDLSHQAAEKQRRLASLLKRKASLEALPRQKQALAELEAEARKRADQLQTLNKELGPARFAALRQQQSDNRASTGGITESVRGLGESGSQAVGELLRAGDRMSSAEQALEQSRPEPAGDEQRQALESMKLARRELAAEEERLLDQLRAEVRIRVIDTAKLMLEKQTAIRESTAALAPQLKQHSRQALAAAVGLSERETELSSMADELAKLVEETDFGVALPAVLRMIRGEMSGVATSLAASDASDPVIAAERRIEADLTDLLEAMKRMPSSRKPSGDPQQAANDRERELNRLLAELKMVRMLQVRVNHETVDVDGKRTTPRNVPDPLRREIGDVESHQEQVRTTTTKLSERPDAK